MHELTLFEKEMIRAFLPGVKFMYKPYSYIKGLYVHLKSRLGQEYTIIFVPVLIEAKAIIEIGDKKINKWDSV